MATRKYKTFDKTKYAREYMREYSKTQAFKDKAPLRNEIARRARKKLRLTLLEKLGGAFCVECGCNIIEALELNHIEGGGNKEIKEYRKSRDFKRWGSANWRFILENPEEQKKYNIMCRLCNSHHYLRDIKKINGGTFKVIFTPNKQKELPI